MRVAARDVSQVNPSVLFWGGPTGIDTDGTAAGDQVFTYGNSSLRGGAEPLAPHTKSASLRPGCRRRLVAPFHTVTPGIPGTPVGLPECGRQGPSGCCPPRPGPLPASNNIGDLAHELAWARHSGLKGLRLVPGTEPFSGLG